MKIKAFQLLLSNGSFILPYKSLGTLTYPYTLSSLTDPAKVPDDAVCRAHEGSHDPDEKDQREDGFKARFRLNQTKTLAIIPLGRILERLENEFS